MRSLPTVRKASAFTAPNSFTSTNRTLPTEEEQFTTYLAVAQRVSPDPLIIRTLDLGGDKLTDNIESGDELNPFLGWRAIRFCLENVQIFKTQLRAILRASVYSNIKMMFPMISGLDEVRRGLQIVEECKAELRFEGINFNEALEVGVMIEVPTAAIMADLLAREVDFFSIGTNDLIQYAVAIDRTNERVAHLYEPSHPSVVRLLKMVADAAHANDIWVGVCGEMAGEVLFTPLLLGLGMDELSANASLVPRVKSAVQRLTITECRELVEAALLLDTPAAVLARCQEAGAKKLSRAAHLIVRFGFAFRLDIRFDSVLFHLAQNVAHVVDFVPDLLADVNLRFLLHGHGDAIARASIKFDDFFLLQLVLGANNHPRVVGRVFQVIDDNALDLRSQARS